MTFFYQKKKKKNNGIYAQIEFRAPIFENPWAAMVYEKTARLNLLLTKFWSCSYLNPIFRREQIEITQI